MTETRAEQTEKIANLIDHIGTVFRGKPDVVELAVTALLAGGHILLEDVPGVGKTTLAQALARSVGADFRRIQFTSDLLPADIVGVSIFSRKDETFHFEKGPIFANIVLADEINRTTPRTQSALLEAMAEGRVSLDRQTHQLPRPFTVLATQNPLDYHGTYPLPESQLDRFLVRLSIGYPEADVERDMLISRRRSEPVHELAALMTLDELAAAQKAVDQIKVEDSLADYVLQVIQQTRRNPALRTGVSTRGALALMRGARAHALLRGRSFCTPDDFLRLFVPVLAHRVSLAGSGGSLGQDRDEAEAVIDEIVQRVNIPV